MENVLCAFKHGSKAEEGDVGMSFDLVFRLCCHVKEVSKSTGKLMEAEKMLGCQNKPKELMIFGRKDHNKRWNDKGRQISKSKVFSHEKSL